MIRNECSVTVHRHVRHPRLDASQSLGLLFITEFLEFMTFRIGQWTDPKGDDYMTKKKKKYQIPYSYHIRDTVGEFRFWNARTSMLQTARIQTEHETLSSDSVIRCGHIFIFF